MWRRANGFHCRCRCRRLHPPAHTPRHHCLPPCACCTHVTHTTHTTQRRHGGEAVGTPTPPGRSTPVGLPPKAAHKPLKFGIISRLWWRREGKRGTSCAVQCLWGGAKAQGPRKQQKSCASARKCAEDSLGSGTVRRRCAANSAPKKPPAARKWVCVESCVTAPQTAQKTPSRWTERWAAEGALAAPLILAPRCPAPLRPKPSKSHKSPKNAVKNSPARAPSLGTAAHGRRDSEAFKLQ